MRLIALVDSPDHVCCRYRLAAFGPLLARAGHVLELRALPRTWWRRWKLFGSLRGASIVLQRRLLAGWELARLRRVAQHLLFDFDDAIFLRDSYSPRGLRHPRRLRRFRNTVRACDVIVAGNRYLADEAARWVGAHRVQRIPTCVDPARYPLAPPNQREGGVELVWIGSSSTLQGLQAVAPLLDAVGRQLPGTRLKVICDRFFRLQDLPIVPCPWTAEGEAAELAAADVGISWVPDDLWSRGKCGLKVLQYLAAGLPVVANPVGVHREMIRHGENGFLAETPSQWVEALSLLARDPALRRRMGQVGRRRLEQDYSVARGATLWARMLDGLSQPLARVG